MVLALLGRGFVGAQKDVVLFEWSHRAYGGQHLVRMGLQKVHRGCLALVWGLFTRGFIGFIILWRFVDFICGFVGLVVEKKLESQYTSHVKNSNNLWLCK